MFYIDPPYLGVQLYRHNFGLDDVYILAERLTKLKGKFILSLNDRSEVRNSFSRFFFSNVETTYTAKIGATGKRYRELLITNFHPTGKERNGKS